MRMEHWFYAMPLRLRSLFRRQRVEHELDEELRYHLDQKIDEYIAQGQTPRSHAELLCARWTALPSARKNAVKRGA